MQKQPNSRTCFLCGRENKIGLKMSWYNDIQAEQVVSDIIVPEDYNGFPGFVHGGIIATLLDETSGRALMLKGDPNNLFVTASLEIKYRNPTPTNVPLKVVGWIEKGNDKRARVAGEIRLSDGTVTAECKALVVRPPDKYFEIWNWEEEGKHWKVD